MSTGAFVYKASCLFEGFVGFSAVFDAGYWVDVGQVAASCSTAYVVGEIARTNLFPVVFGKGRGVCDWKIFRGMLLIGGLAKTYGRCLRGSGAHSGGVLVDL